MVVRRGRGPVRDVGACVVIGLAVAIIVALEVAYALHDRWEARRNDPVRAQVRRDARFAHQHMIRGRR